MSATLLIVLSLLASQLAPKSPPAPAPAASRPKAPAPSSKAFDDLSRRAQEAHAAQKLDEALALYEKALEMRPGWTEGRFGLGTVLYDLDRHRDARTAFRRVAAEQPESGPAWAFKGMCEFQLKNYEQALADLQKGRLLGLGGNANMKTVVDFHAAILLTRFEHYEVAREILRDFALGDKDSPGVIEALGLAGLRLPYVPGEAPAEKREMILIAGRALFHFTRNRYSPAARFAFEELVTRYPEEPGAHYAYGAFLMTLNEVESGLAEFRRVLAIQPTHVPAMLQIALNLLKQGDFSQALPYAEKAALTEPDFFAAHNALGRIQLELGRTDEAIEHLEKAARLAPNSAQTFFALARAYQRAGRTEDVRKAREKFMELDAAMRAELMRGQTQDLPLDPVSPKE